MGNKKSLVGQVVSFPSELTAKVKVSLSRAHSVYNKQVRTSKSYLVHATKSDVELGDKVRIESCRPISKRKKHRLVEIIKV